MKKLLYLLATIILISLLSYAGHVLLLIKLGYEFPVELHPYQRYLLFPLWAQISTPLLGLGAGRPIGQRRRDIVYIERRHWWFKYRDSN